MRIAQAYSHLNRLEFLQVHKPYLCQEIQHVIQNVDAGLAFDKVSHEKTMPGRILYSPAKLNKLFQAQFNSYGWHEMRHDYFVNEDLNTTRAIIHLQDKDEQRRIIHDTIFFGKYFSVKHIAP